MSSGRGGRTDSAAATWPARRPTRASNAIGRCVSRRCWSGPPSSAPTVLATGHYARVVHGPGGYRLRRGVDPGKDQSYVLHMLTQDQLARIRLPVGELTKPEVRGHATRLGLRTADKPDSQEICFVGSRQLPRLPGRALPRDRPPRPDRRYGRHRGRLPRGNLRVHRWATAAVSGVALQEPRFVVEIDAATATVVIGDRDDLLAGGCVVRAVSFVSGRPPAGGAIEVKVRYRSQPVPARLEAAGDGWLVRFDEAQAAVAPGQAAVFYDGDEVLGGGTIERSIP